MLTVSRTPERGGRRGGNRRAALTLEMQEDETTQRLRPCRAIIAVDTSPSMDKLIDAACEGIAGINSALNDEDLVSVM